MADDPTRWIQAWNHAGNSHLIHAIADIPTSRKLITLGRLGYFTRPACVMFSTASRMSSGSGFFRLIGSPQDNPTRDYEGWVTDYDVHGMDWDQPVKRHERRCERCASALRKVVTTHD